MEKNGKTGLKSSPLCNHMAVACSRNRMKSHGFFSAQPHLPGRSEEMSARGSDAADVRLVLKEGSCISPFTGTSRVI